MTTNVSDFENALVTSIITEKAMKTVLSQKITPEHFTTSSAKAAFLFLMKWYRNPAYNDTPSWETFKLSFPDFKVVATEDSISAICDIVRDTLIYADISDMVNGVAQAAQEDPREALALIQRTASKLTTRHVVDDSAEMTSLIPGVKERYFTAQANPDAMLGLPYPWEPLNRALLGAQDGHLIFIYARPKSGKSTLACVVIVGWIKLRKRGLIITQEMLPEEMTTLVASIFSGVDDAQLAKGRLHAQDEADFVDNMDALQELPLPIITRVSGIGDAALMEITALIDQHNPDWLYIDGVYLLCNNDWKVIADMTRGLKRTAAEKRIPILATTQASKPVNKTKVGDAPDDFGGSDTYYQDCDAAIRVQSTPEDKKQHQARIWIAAARKMYVSSCAMVVNFYPSRDFSLREEIDMEANPPPPEDGGSDTRAGE